jgi:hypothetical protein
MVKKIILLVLTFSLVVFLDTRANAASTVPNTTIAVEDCGVKKIGPRITLLKCFNQTDLIYVGFSVAQSTNKVVVYWQDARDNRAKFTCTYLARKDKKVNVTCNPYW